jgi:hypothetical protein
MSVWLSLPTAMQVRLSFPDQEAESEVTALVQGHQHFDSATAQAARIAWDLWRTKCHWVRFSLSASVSSGNSHFTDCSQSSSIIRGC